MILIIGLGNQGEKYAKTRHNAGFMALDALQEDVNFNFSQWRENKKFSAFISESIDKKIKLLKPTTFMNESGRAAAATARFYKIKPENIWVAHDDLDLPVGKIKVQQNRSAAGHNGIKSIIEYLGTQNFGRFRIGIAPEKKKTASGSNIVLKKFTAQENKTIKSAIQKISAAISYAITNGLAKTMNKFNTNP